MSKAKVLVVEDEPNLLLGIRDILELDDYSVLTAANGKDALDVLTKMGDSIPDLIVSDIMMPIMDGLQFLQEVRRNNTWVMIPFIFLTAKGSKHDVQQGKLLGVDDYLIKPFDADDLLIAVASRLERHRRMNEAQAGAISSVKRNILTILNHEFRTPLTLVVAYADMLREGDVTQMNQAELLMFLKEINSGAERLRRLIENFIVLVEIETGDAEKTYQWRRAPINDIETIIQQAVNKQFNDNRNGTICQVEVHDDLPTFMGDKEYLIMMLVELINNAVKFSPNEKRIRVEAETVGGDLHIRVRDKGMGIRPEKLQEIWDTFTQVDREVYEHQGAGSGLAIVKGLSLLHGAKIEVESEVGKGSCFTVILRPS